VSRRAAELKTLCISTGPRTEEGKARSSQNARRHGFYADPNAVASPEDAAELARLQEDLIAFHRPLNSQELLVLDKIARAQQAILRAYRLQSAVFASLEVPSPTPEDGPPAGSTLGDNFLRLDHKIWSGLLRFQAHADNSYHRAVEELDRLKSIRHLLPPSQRELRNEPAAAPQPQATTPPPPPLRELRNEPTAPPLPQATAPLPARPPLPNQPTAPSPSRVTCFPFAPEPPRVTARGPGLVKILDFGLAKAAPMHVRGAEAGETATTLTVEDQLTGEGTAVGTVPYMSPEQVCAKELDARTDLFSLGVVLYEMATARLPFSGESTGLVFDAILNRAPVPAARLNPDLPVELERIIGKCLEKDRNLRYQHAAEIRTDLERLKRDSGRPSDPRSLAASAAARPAPMSGWRRPRY